MSASALPSRLQQVLQNLRTLPQTPENMPMMISLLREALGYLDPDLQPQPWAVLNHVLGVSLAQNPLGSRAQNLEDAIAAFEEALKFFTRQTYPGSRLRRTRQPVPDGSTLALGISAGRRSSGSWSSTRVTR